MTLHQGTQTTKPAAVEFGVDTVYERKNIVRKTGEKDRAGNVKPDYWEYEEKTYTYSEYCAKQQKNIDDIMLAQVELANLITGGG